jgi:cytoskeletal protein CcmA (bactofilin family)
MLKGSAWRARRLWPALALLLVLVPTSHAATFGTDETVEVASGETVTGNFYAAGQTVRVSGTVTGDLVAAGSLVEVAEGGVVEGDVIAAGQSVVVKGRVDGDIRAAGAVVQAEPGAEIGGELIGAGYSVGLAQGAAVGDDMIAFAAQGIVDGDVAGDLIFRGAGLSINGTVEGNVDAEVDAQGESMPPMTVFPFMQQAATPLRSIQSGLEVGPEAQIGGDLKVVSPEAVTVPSAAVGGEVQSEVRAVEARDAEPAAAQSPAMAWLVASVKDLVALLVIGLLLLWLTPRVLGGVGEVLSSRALPSAGWGCLSLIAAVVGLIALAVATVFALIVVGLLHIGPLVGPILSASVVIGVLLTFGMVLVSWLARVAVALWIGRLLLARAGRTEQRVLGLLIGAVIYAVLMNLPVAGWLLDLVGVVLGLGALVLFLRRLWPARGLPVAEPMPPATPAPVAPGN